MFIEEILLDLKMYLSIISPCAHNSRSFYHSKSRNLARGLYCHFFQQTTKPQANNKPQTTEAHMLTNF